MYELGSKKYKNVLVLLTDDDKKMLKNSLSKYQRQMKNGGVIVMSPFLNYFSSFVELLAVLAEDKNGATERKCESYYPLEKLIHMFTTYDLKKCWVMRSSLATFYYHVYCDAETGVNYDRS